MQHATADHRQRRIYSAPQAVKACPGGTFGGTSYTSPILSETALETQSRGVVERRPILRNPETRRRSASPRLRGLFSVWASWNSASELLRLKGRFSRRDELRESPVSSSNKFEPRGTRTFEIPSAHTPQRNRALTPFQCTRRRCGCECSRSSRLRPCTR